MGEFCLLVELYPEGSALQTAQQTWFLYTIWYQRTKRASRLIKMCIFCYEVIFSAVLSRFGFEKLTRFQVKLLITKIFPGKFVTFSMSDFRGYMVSIYDSIYTLLPTANSI